MSVVTLGNLMAFKEPADKDLDENEGAAIGSGVRWGSIY